jgi:Ser/Thr protein kinase RdoA (MazF antagonist)
MDNTQIRYIDIAKQALSEYRLFDCTLTFIRHSDNVTYKVDDPTSGVYLLRIHVPVTPAMGSHGSDIHMINSELQWLEALNNDTDLVLQKPVRNREGSLVTQTLSKMHSLSINCTLLRWINGQPYHRDLESKQTARQIGRILATLHNHASQWKIPEAFTRPKRDVEYFSDVLQGIKPALEDGRIHQSDYDEFEQSINRLNSVLETLDVTQQRFGIMHADTHKGNMLINNGKIHLIDFSFCASGNYMFDLGICLSDMKSHLHHICLQAYQNLRVLPEGYQKLIEGFFVGSMVGTFSFWVDNPNAQQLLVNKFPKIARQYAVKYNRGEHFWFPQESKSNHF